MTYVVIGLAIALVVCLIVINNLSIQLRQRDAHMAWVDQRDAFLRPLAQAAHDLRNVRLPPFNLDAWCEHGMVTRNAVQNAAAILQHTKEQADAMRSVYRTSTRRITDAYEYLVSWEREHPAPPVAVDYWDYERHAEVTQ